MDYDDPYEEDQLRPPDLVEEKAIDELRAFFEDHREVFSSRQIEVMFEQKYFHWITHRALSILAQEGTIRLEAAVLSYGAPINFVWHRSNRYNRRQIKEILRLVEQYSHQEFTAALGNTAELLVSDGFSRFEFVQRGRETRKFGGREWTNSDHNLDFLFERDKRVYGVEVKNTLAYINDKEFRIKARYLRASPCDPSICRPGDAPHLGPRGCQEWRIRTGSQIPALSAKPQVVRE